jgi:anti-anti-sigma factor
MAGYASGKTFFEDAQDYLDNLRDSLIPLAIPLGAIGLTGGGVAYMVGNAMAQKILGGVVIGIALSLGWLVSVITTPEMPVLEHADGRAVVRLDGDLFFATADALHDRLREVAEGSEPPLREVVLDLSSVEFMDLHGLAVLMRATRRARVDGGSFALQRPAHCVMRLLELVRLDGEIPILPDGPAPPDVA